MTTGERLVDISTLLTGTAMEHFLNISVGGGTVSGAIFDVELQEPDAITVTPETPIDVGLEESDFDVKVVEKITIITKE